MDIIVNYYIWMIKLNNLNKQYECLSKIIEQNIVAIIIGNCNLK